MQRHKMLYQNHSLNQRISSSIFIFVCQLICFLVLHDLIVHIAMRYKTNFSRDVAWGITARLIFLNFAILAFMQQVFAIIYKGKMLFLFSGIISLIYLLTIYPYFVYHPLKALNIFLTGVGNFFAIFIFGRLLFLIKKLFKRVERLMPQIRR